MGRLFNFVFKVGAVLGIAYAAKKLADNKDVVKAEYDKAKEDPKAYAQNVQEKAVAKAQDVQDKAKVEYNKAKEDPKAYAQNVQEKASNKAQEVQTKANEKVDEAKVAAKDVQNKAKEEYSKAKEDPEAYKENLKAKGKEKAEEVKKEAKEVKKDVEAKTQDEVDAKPDKETPDNLAEREATLADEGGLTEDEIQNFEKEHNVDVTNDEGDLNENHNVHVVIDKKKNK